MKTHQTIERVGLFLAVRTLGRQHVVGDGAEPEHSLEQVAFLKFDRLFQQKFVMETDLVSMGFARASHDFLSALAAHGLGERIAGRIGRHGW